jgi:hypothetical protein
MSHPTPYLHASSQAKGPTLRSPPLADIAASELPPSGSSELSFKFELTSLSLNNGLFAVSMVNAGRLSVLR